MLTLLIFLFICQTKGSPSTLRSSIRLFLLQIIEILLKRSYFILRNLIASSIWLRHNINHLSICLTLFLRRFYYPLKCRLSTIIIRLINTWMTSTLVLYLDISYWLWLSLISWIKPSDLLFKRYPFRLLCLLKTLAKLKLVVQGWFLLIISISKCSQLRIIF